MLLVDTNYPLTTGREYYQRHLRETSQAKKNQDGSQLSQAAVQDQTTTGISANPSVEYAKEHAGDDRLTIPTTFNNAFPGQGQEPEGLSESTKQYSKSNVDNNPSRFSTHFAFLL